MEELSK